MNTLRVMLIAILGFGAVQAEAQKAKKPMQPPGELFFTRKGMPFALERVAPGIQGALLLTDEQKQRLMEALEKTIWSEEARSAGRLLKSGVGATEAQEKEAHRVIESARMRLQEQIGSVLSKEQKELVGRINTASEEAHGLARKKLEVEFTATKGDKSRQEELNRQMQEEAKTEFDRLLAGILTAAQREGMDRAAQQQRQAEEAATKKGK